MSRGYEEHKNRVNSLSQFGKDLVRRSNSKCELCEAQGVSLKILEVDPVPKTPDYNHCIFICDECQSSMNKPEKFSNHWRCLNGAVWSDVTAIQVQSVLILRAISVNEEWAGDLIDQVILSEETEGWLTKL